MRRSIGLAIIFSLLLVFMPGMSHCSAADSKLELNWDFLNTTTKSRDLDTVSLHILEKISEKNYRSVYRGITITRVRGNILPYQQTQTVDSSANGIGPVFMVRNEKHHSGKLTVAVDMSGGLIIYNTRFPTGGERYNFMWRIGPQFIYKATPDTSLSLGYMFMHVSNGLHSQTHNPSYNAHGVSLGFTTKF